MQFVPGVRIVLGFLGTAENPPPNYASPPTLALQEAVRARGKDWKRVADQFVVAPVAGSKQVVVGLACGKVPVAYDTPRMLGPNTAISAKHTIVGAGFSTPPDVDKYGNVRADEGILPAIQGASDPRLAGLGLVLQDTHAPPQYFLVSDDGRAGAFVFGQVLWKPGADYEGAGVRTWSRDYGGGEVARLVGTTYREVSAESPVVILPSDHPSQSAHDQTTRKAVKSLLDTPAPWGWWLVCDEAPTALPQNTQRE